MSKKILVNGEEMEVEEEVHPVAAHFMTETTEEDLKAIHELKVEIEALKGLLEAKVQAVKDQNKGTETLQRGKYVAFLKIVSGRATTDWKRAYKDAVGEMPESDIEKYITRGEDTVRLEVRQLGSGPGD